MTIGVLNQAQKASVKTEVSKFIEAANMVYADLYATRLENGGNLDISIGDIVSKMDADYDEYEFQNAGASTQTLTGFKKLLTDDDETLITSIEVPKGETVTVYPVYANGSNVWYAKIQGAWRQVSYNAGKSSIEVGEVETNVGSTGDGLQATVPNGSGITVTPNSTNTSVEIKGNTAISNASVSLTYNGGTAKTLTVTVEEYFTVTFKDYSGTDGAEAVFGTVKVKSGETATAPSGTPTKPYKADENHQYNFSGKWMITSEGSTEAILTNISSDLTVYADFTVGEKGTPVTISSSNWTDYLGQRVSYTPGNHGKGYGTGTTYRVFYCDGSRVYLKADKAGNNTTLNGIWSGWTESEKARTTLVNLNNIGCDSENQMSANAIPATLSDSGIKGALYLADSEVWKNWKDGTLAAKDSTMYVIGGPTLGMYVASYNAFMDKYNKGDVTLKTGASGNPAAKKLICKYQSPGMKLGLSPSDYDTNSGNYQYVTKGSVSTNATDEIKTVARMYNPESGNYWLASPSAGDANYVMRVYGGGSYVLSDDYNGSLGVCPLVSLSSSVQLTVLGY